VERFSYAATDICGALETRNQINGVNLFVHIKEVAMPSIRTGLVALTMVFSLPHALHGQVDSGPAAGSKVEALKVLTITGDDAGKEVDYATTRKDKPTVYVFIQADKFDRPVARFLKGLDEKLAKERTDVAIVAVWLTEDVDKTKDHLPKVQESMKLTQTTLTVYKGDKGGPNAWNVNGVAHLTAVIAHDNKVEASLGFGSINETDMPAVFKKIKPKK
jgi:hypothetical protein